MCIHVYVCHIVSHPCSHLTLYLFGPAEWYHLYTSGMASCQRSFQRMTHWLYSPQRIHQCHSIPNIKSTVSSITPVRWRWHHSLHVSQSTWSVSCHSSTTCLRLLWCWNDGTRCINNTHFYKHTNTCLHIFIFLHELWPHVQAWLSWSERGTVNP